MPRVVIELQANTQDAVNKIQQFARAQKDAFDAIKVGNATLADATVKVSKLTESTSAAAKGFGALDAAGKNWIHGSLRELTGGIPLLDSALSKMIGTLGGFPLVAGGVVAGGVLLIKTLMEISAEASKTNAAILTLSKSIESDLQRTMGNIAKLRAEGAGQEGPALAIGAQNQIKALKDARDAAIAAAQKELDKTPDPRGALIPISLPERILAESTFQTARAKATEDAALKIFEIETKLKNDLAQLDTNYTNKLDENREKNLQNAAEAAEKQKKLLQDLTTSALSTFKDLGAGFEDVTKSLELAQFVEKTQQKIAELNQGIELGIDTHGRFAAGVQALQEKMAEAIKLGYVPTIEKAKELSEAIEDTGDAALSAGERWLRSIEGISSALDAVIAKSRAAGAAAASGGGPVSGPSTGAYDPVYGPSVIGTIAATGSFQHGGIVPGTGPVPIIAHGGERIIPASQAGGAGAMVRIEPGAIQISGTVIDQSRDWGVLVETLGQAIAARLR